MTAIGASLRFLVVDDNDDIRHVLTCMVEKLGHSAAQARDGVEAIEALAVETYDFMLLDLTMPRMSGEDVLLWLRKHPEWAADMRVVVVSAWAAAIASALVELGADAVLRKPLRTSELKKVIEAERLILA